MTTTTPTTNEEGTELRKAFLILHEDDQDSSNDDVSSVHFLMFPSRKYQQNVVKLIQREGGSVQDFQKDLVQDHTIVLINMTAVWKEQEALLQKDTTFPNDAFDMQLVQDYLNNPDIDMVNYRITPTIYQAHNPKDVMLQKTSWSRIAKIVPKRDRPQPKTLQQLLTETDDSLNEEEVSALATTTSTGNLSAESTSVQKGNKNPRPLVEFEEARAYPVPRDKRGRLRVFANRASLRKKSNQAAKSSDDELLEERDGAARDPSSDVDLEPSPKRCRSMDSSIALLSSDEDVSYSESTSSNTTTTTRVIVERRTKAVSFSNEEGQRMLDLVVKNGWIKHVKGRALWQFVVSEYLLETFTNIHRSWESLWEHMRKKVLHSFKAGKNLYQATPEDRKALMSVYKSKVMNDAFQEPSLDSVKGIDLQAVKAFKARKSAELRKKVRK